MCTLKDKIIEYLKEKPIEPNVYGQYQRIADELETTAEYVRKIIRTYNLADTIINFPSSKRNYANKNQNELFPETDFLTHDCGCRIEEEISDNEKTIVFTGSQVPESEEEVIKHYKIDLTKWFIDKIKFNSWGTEDKLNKQCTVVLRKIIPDIQKIPVLKQLKMENHPYIISSDRTPRDNNKIKKTVILSDAHIGFRKHLLSNSLFPFHDRTAISLSLNLLNYIQPDELILSGDMIDVTEAGKYTKEPEFYFTTQPALIEFHYMLQQIRSFLPNTKIVYMMGNHEHRIYKHAMENMAFAWTLKNPKTDYSILSLRNLLDLDSFDIEFIEDYPGGQYWINENLRVVHGDYTKIDTELKNSKVSTIMGHLHRIEKKFKTSHGRDGIDKMFVETVGGLCKIDGTVPGVSKQPDWQQSILLVNTVDKFFDTKQIVFHDGRTIHDNKLFVGSDYTAEINKQFEKMV